MPYYEGQPVPLAFTLTDAGGNPVEAVSTQPACTVTLPDLTTAAPAVAYSGSQYAATGPSSQAGHYRVAWSCDDATYPGGFTDAYDICGLTETAVISLAEMKRTLRIDAGDDSEDDFITEFGRAATSIVEWFCGPVNQQAVTEELRVGGLTCYLSKPPVLSLTAWDAVPPQFAADASRVVPSPPSPMFPVMVYGVTYPLADLYADPRRGEVRHTSGLPFYYGPYLWQYQAGRPVVPQCIQAGFRVILKHIFGMERGGGAGTASLGEADEETSDTPLGFAVPNRALELMAPEALAGAIA